MKKAPSCELLDQLDAEDMDKGILLYNLDDYGKRIFEKLSELTNSGFEINEEDKVTIAEAFSEIDEDQTGGVSESKLDNLFKSCRRELPGYELRKITDSRQNHDEPISLKEFAEFYIDQRSNDYSNKFKASIKVVLVSKRPYFNTNLLRKRRMLSTRKIMKSKSKKQIR